jgi:hypothetical protein
MADLKMARFGYDKHGQLLGKTTVTFAEKMGWNCQQVTGRMS